MAVFIGILLLALTSSAVAAPKCSRTGRYDLTSPGPWSMHISTRAGTTCESTFNAGHRVTFKRLLLVTRPARGAIALREGGYYIYSAPQTPGTDTFMLRICGVQGSQEGCADLKYTVAVD